MDLAARNVRQRFPDQPLVEAGIRVTLWQVYFALDDLDRAEEHNERAIVLYDGTDAPELQRLKALKSMAWMHHARGRYAEATGLIEPALARRTRLQGADHPDVLSAQRCRLAVLSSSGRHPEALALGEDLLRRARQLPVAHTEVLLGIMTDVSGIYFEQGEFPRCHALSEEAFHIAQERLGKEHALTIELMSDWAHWLRLRLGRFHEAGELQQEAYDRAHEILGETHDSTLKSLSELAWLADAKGLFGKRIEIQEQLVPLAQQAFGPDSPNAMYEQLRLGWSRLDEGRLEDAEALLTHAMDRLRETRGPDDLLTRRAMRWLSPVFGAQGRYAEAIELRQDVVDRLRRLLGADSHWTRLQMCRLANLHARVGQWQPTAQLFAEFLPRYDPAKSIYVREDIYAAGLAGDNAAIAAIGPLALRHARQGSLPWETRRNLIVNLLLVADLVPNGAELDAFAAQWIADVPTANRDELLLALQALRLGQFGEVTRLLAPLSAHPAHPSAGLASALTAMAQHRLGNSREANRLLLDALNRLELLSRAGDLGRTIVYPREEWLPAAQLELACREAELLIHGRRIHPALDQTTLADARERWLPVRTLLDEADRAATRGDWPNALDHLRAAIHHDHFDWSAVLQSRENFAAKAALILHRGGELGAHPDLGERILEWDSGIGSLGVRTLLLLENETLPPATLASLVTKARRAARDGPSLDAGNPW